MDFGNALRSISINVVKNIPCLRSSLQKVDWFDDDAS